jgi:hypothetical protein
MRRVTTIFLNAADIYAVTNPEAEAAGDRVRAAQRT